MDYKIGGTWGNCIEWMVDDWAKVNFELDELKCYGFNSRIPKVGDYLLCEMQRSYMKFMFVSIRPCRYPDDMFFATVKAIEQRVK